MKKQCPTCNNRAEHMRVVREGKNWYGCLSCGGFHTLAQLSAEARKYNFEHTYSVKDVSEILNVTPRTIRRWVQSGRLPKPSKIHTQLRWQAEEIENALP